MADPSRMDRLIGMLGGEENLPPQLPQQTNASESTNEATKADAPAKQQNWWNAEPDLEALPVPVAVPQNGSPPVAVVPRLPDANSHYDFVPRLGELAPLGMKFAPFLAVTKFCYKFVRKDLQQPLATAFFDAGKIYTRGWDL